MATDTEKTVFISYRRRVSAGWARAIFMDLQKHGYDVFMDVESIGSGTFETIILNQIEARAHFLVILTPGTVERFGEPGDWLRREIEHAMDVKRNVVPLLLHDFKFGDYEADLTGKLAALPGYNALNVPHDFFDEAMDKLRTRFLKQPVEGTVQPAPVEEQAEVERKVAQAASQPAPSEAELTAEEWLARGYALWEQGNVVEAIVAYSEALRLNPEYAEAYNNRGVVRSEQGDQEGATADFDEALRLDPEYAGAYVNRGSARADQGDLAGAIVDYDEAIRLDPDYSAAYYNRGLSRYKQGDLDGAIADFDEALRLDPAFAGAYNSRGVARSAQSDLADAIADFDEAIQLNPEFSEAFSNRGEAYFAQGDHSSSLADFKAALKLDPEYRFALAGLAIALHALGKSSEAEEQWRKLLADDSRFGDADWVGQEFNWRPELVEAARKLISKLD